MTGAGSMMSVGIAAIGGVACALTILASRRRVLLPALFVQFVCAALLLPSLPVALAMAVGLVGACVCAILAVTPDGQQAGAAARQGGIPSGLPFRVVAVMLVSLASVSLASAVLPDLEGAAPGIPIGAGLLMGLGLLQIGLSEEPLRAGCGMMAIVSGFQIGYATVENAIALHGLVLLMPLLMAVGVAYLKVLPGAGREGSA